MMLALRRTIRRIMRGGTQINPYHVAMCVLLATASLARATAISRRINHKRFVIHVPLKLKSHHHTHTVFSHIHHGGGKVEYKVLGYTRHGHGNVFGHFDGHGTDARVSAESDYYDSDGYGTEGYDNSHPGDIVFNHYARTGGTNHIPAIGELITGAHSTEWER